MIFKLTWTGISDGIGRKGNQKVVVPIVDGYRAQGYDFCQWERSGD